MPPDPPQLPKAMPPRAASRLTPGPTAAALALTVRAGPPQAPADGPRPRERPQALADAPKFRGQTREQQWPGLFFEYFMIELHVYLHIRVYIHMYIHTHIYICIFTYTYVI